jgi:hypothetical protein
MHARRDHGALEHLQAHGAVQEVQQTPDGAAHAHLLRHVLFALKLELGAQKHAWSAGQAHIR